MIAGRTLVTAAVLAAALAATSPAAAQLCPQQWQLDRGVMFDHTDAPLTEISGLVVSRRGTTFVAAEKSNTIYFFASDGTLAGSFGRAGEGPGEFRNPGNLVLVGDSVWAMDDSLLRGTMFDLDRRVARTVPFTRSYLPYMAGDVYPLGDRYAMLPNVGAQSLRPEGFTTPLLLLNADGQVADTLGDPLLRRNVIGVIELPGGQAFVQLPTPHVDYTAFDPAGGAFVFATGEITRDGGRIVHVAKVDAAGDTVLARSIELAAARVPDSFLDAEFDTLVARFGNRFSSPAAARRAVEQAWRVSEHFWPVNGLMVDNDSRIWIRTGGIQNQWMVLVADAAPATCVRLPDNVRPYAAQGTYLWTIYSDENGVPLVVRYGLQPI